MKRIIVSAAAALSLSLLSNSAFAQINPKLPAPGEAPAGSPVAVHGALTVSGGKINDKNNTAVVLRGMSFDWSSDASHGAYYNANVVGWLTHDWRVSVLRAAMTVHSGDDDDGRCDGDAGYTDGNASANRTRVENVVKAAIERGIYVIIDWHMHNLTTSSGSNCSNKGVNLTSAASTFFGEMAQTYGAYPNVIYEVWNEPLSHSWSDIAGYSNQVISAIRAKNANGVVVVGSPSWSSTPNNASGVTGTNVAYTMHFYANEHTSSSGHFGNMTSAVSGGKAVFATEWGTTSASGDGTVNQTESNAWINKMEEIKVSWVNWRISSPISRSGSSINQTSQALDALGTSGGPWTLKPSGTYIRGKIVGYNNTAYSSWSKTYPINITITGSGTVEKRVGNTVNNGPYNFGDEVTIKAVPAAGSQFDHWEGDASGGNASPSSYKINGRPLDIKAFFMAGSMIKNGLFTTNTENWAASGITAAHEDGTLKATVTGTTAFVRQTGLSMAKNTKYKLSFRAKAGSGSVSLTPRITNSSGTNYWEAESAQQLTTSWKTVEISDICMNADDDNAQIRFQTNGQSGVVWYLDDVAMDASGTCQSTSVLPSAVRVSEYRTGWSVSRTGGALQLRGPAEAGARVSLYDVRGKMVRSMAAVDGLTLGGVPAGNYIMVVRNGSGKESLRTRVVLAR